MSAPTYDLDEHLAPAQRATGAELAGRLARAVDHDPVTTPDWATVARHRAGVRADPRATRHARLRAAVTVAAAVAIVVGGLVVARRDGGSVAVTPGTTAPATVAPDVGFTPLQLDRSSGLTLQGAGRGGPPFQPASMGTDLERSVVYRPADDPYTTPSLLVSIAPWEAEWGFTGSPGTPPNATVGGHPALIVAGARPEIRLHVGDHLIHGRATGLTVVELEWAMETVVIEDDRPRLLRPPAGFTANPAWLPRDRQRVIQAYAYEPPGRVTAAGTGLVNLWVLPDEPGGLDTALQFVLDEGLGQPEGPTLERATAQGRPAIRSWRPIADGFIATVAWRDPGRRAVVLLNASVPSLDRMDALVGAVVELDDEGRREIKVLCDARPPGLEVIDGPTPTDGLGC